MNTPKKPRRRRPKPLLTFTSEIPWLGRADDEPFMAGYVRCSTDQQDTQRQVDELVRAGVSPLDIWGDYASGATMDPHKRPGWHGCMRDLRAGDILVVHSLERLSRDTLDTLTTMRELTERGVRVKVLNMDLDASTPIGRFALTIFAAFGQLERDMALERTRSGLARAKERGVKLGASRKFTLAAIRDAVEVAGTYEGAATRLGCKKITIQRGMDEIKAAEAKRQARD